MNVEKASEKCNEIIERISEIFVGKKQIVVKLLASALANGHVLFEDNPGLGKTLLAKVFAKLIDCEFKRCQFTPDLLPADLVGTYVWRGGEFQLYKGPVFTNVLLADEINRAPPKTQSALLEAMEEHQVTIEGRTFTLERPFIVLATQNPIEYEGTYPLPEAQLDRFLMRLSTGYPENLEEECEIIRRRIKWKKDDPSVDIKPVISKEEFIKLQNMAEEIYVDEAVIKYIGEIVRETRNHKFVEVGSSPRGSLALLRVSRALALIKGRDFVVPDDVKFVATDVLSHRIILKLEYEMEGKSGKDVVKDVLEKVEVPKEFMRS
jgi:MoxR-like ATPase